MSEERVLRLFVHLFIALVMTLIPFVVLTAYGVLTISPLIYIFYGPGFAVGAAVGILAALLCQAVGLHDVGWGVVVVPLVFGLWGTYFLYAIILCCLANYPSARRWAITAIVGIHDAFIVGTLYLHWNGAHFWRDFEAHAGLALLAVMVIVAYHLVALWIFYSAGGTPKISQEEIQ